MKNENSKFKNSFKLNSSSSFELLCNACINNDDDNDNNNNNNNNIIIIYYLLTANVAKA